MKKKGQSNKVRFYEKIDVVSLSKYEQERINKMLGFVRGLKIKSLLDLGCITSITELFVEELGCFGLGINLNKTVIKARSDRSIRFIVGDAENLKLNKKFDLIICGELLEHMFNIDEFIEKIKVMMNENSYLLLTTPNLASLFNRVSILLGFQPYSINPSRKIQFNPFIKYDFFNGHVSAMTYYALVKFLRKNGFKILKIGGYHVVHEGENRLRSILRHIMSMKSSFAEGVVVL